jgi:hypothetical protein
VKRAAHAAIVALSIAGTLSCGGSNGASSAPPSTALAGATNPFGIVSVGDVPAAMRKITDRVWRTAARARRLNPKAPVKLRALEPAALVGLVKSKVKEEVPADVIRSEGATFEALGLIPKGFDYEAETYALLEEELAGMYLPDDQTMYVAIGVTDDELDATLAHELVHALQDQYFEIGKKMKYKPGASDALGAMQALAEGDATSAMIDEMILQKKGEQGLAAMTAVDIPDRTAEEFLDDALEDKKPDAAIRKAPRFIALGLVAPYADGLSFVNGLRRRGGWDAVDMAWQKPPTTTEQLLHLEKFDAQEPNVDVPIATAASLGSTFTKKYDDMFGEEEGRLAFSQWMGNASSKRAAEGWGGDRVTLFETSAGDHAVAWRIVYDDDKQAAEAAQILEVGWTSTFGNPTKSSNAGIDVLLFGAPPVAAKPSDTKKKPEVAPKPAKGELPPLPDPDGATTPPQGGAVMSKTGVVLSPGSCRAIAHGGKAIALVAGAPCDKSAAFAAENGKAP